MKVAVIAPEDLGGPELALWRDWQSRDPRLTSPFLTPEFVAGCGRHRPRVRVAVVEDGGAVVAFLPFEAVSRSVARGLGHRLVDCQGIVCDPTGPPPLTEVLRASALAVIEFDHLVGHQAAQLTGRSVLVASPVVDLHAGWEAYLGAKRRAGGRIKRLQTKGRKLAREVGEVHFAYDLPDHGRLDALIGWKRAQYRRTGRGDAFADGSLRALLHDLLEVRSPGFGLRLSSLEAGGRTVALQLCVRGNGVLGSWFPGYDPEFAPYSPGAVGMLALLEAAAADGIGQVDLGKGHEDYKQSLKSGDVEVAQGFAGRAVPAAYWWRAHQSPRRFAFDVVSSSPRTFRVADVLLRRTAALRDRARR